jgi:predicted DNA-binding transcriptional regulator AlpA
MTAKPDSTYASIEATKKSRPTVRPPLPQAHADLALGDINDVKSIIRMGASWIHEAVRDGRFPPPVIRGSRCTRWKISDVRRWLTDLTQSAAANAEAAKQMTARAKKASDAAQAKRAVRPGAAGAG